MDDKIKALKKYSPKTYLPLPHACALTSLIIVSAYKEMVYRNRYKKLIALLYSEVETSFEHYKERVRGYYSAKIETKPTSPFNVIGWDWDS